jgi:hypothetical protein
MIRRDDVARGARDTPKGTRGTRRIFANAFLHQRPRRLDGVEVMRVGRQVPQRRTALFVSRRDGRCDDVSEANRPSPSPAAIAGWRASGPSLGSRAADTRARGPCVRPRHGLRGLPPPRRSSGTHGRCAGHRFLPDPALVEGRVQRRPTRLCSERRELDARRFHSRVANGGRHAGTRPVYATTSLTAGCPPHLAGDSGTHRRCTGSIEKSLAPPRTECSPAAAGSR